MPHDTHVPAEYHPVGTGPAGTSPLRHGDHLNAAEFLRRYEAMPELKKAELLGGEVFMGSPVTGSHSYPHANLVWFLGHYRLFTPSLMVGDNQTIHFDDHHVAQPDAFLIDATDASTAYLNVAPKLVAEIAVSSVALDLYRKKPMYEKFGVQEYVVWRVLDEAIDWFRLEGGTFVPMAQDAAGVYRSQVFPGLWLDVPAMIEGKLDRVFATLQLGLADRDRLTRDG